MGVQEMVVIFLVALVLFGPKKLPELGKTIGKAITEFRRAQSELKATFDHHMRELEKENESVKELTQSYTREINNHIESHYDSPYYDSGAYGADTYQSTAANSTTVSEPAPQGAETPASHETIANGTVPRTPHSTLASEQPKSEEHPGGPENHPGGPENHAGAPENHAGRQNLPESHPVNS
ncbi:MAG: twin-arginine translocase TatA/TatE family subunit [Bryobacteraceae bacterium]